MLDLTPKYIKNYSFRDNGICEYSEYVGEHRSSRSSVKGLFSCYNIPDSVNNNLEDSRAKGIMTKGATKRIHKCLDLWFNAIRSAKKNSFYEQLRTKYHLTFVTLTLSSKQVHDDKFIKRNIFWPWMEVIQRYYGVKNYIWRAEPQANGNIHFHVLIDKYIKHELIRHHWNHHLAKNGYISAYSEARKIYFPLEMAFLKHFTPTAKINKGASIAPDIVRKYQDTNNYTVAQIAHINKFIKYLKNQPNEKTFGDVRARIQADFDSNFSNPNSTDIHDPKNIRNLVAYVSKYMSKKSKPGKEERAINGRCWGRSKDLGKLKYFETSECALTREMLDECKKKGILKIYEDVTFTFFKFPLYSTIQYFSSALDKALRNHFQSCFDFLYNKAGPPQTLNFVEF